jgi:hypothetical protein
MLALALKVGSVFSTVTLALSVSVPPSASVAVAVQVMLSPGVLVEALKVSVSLLPKLLPWLSLVQA